MCDTDRICRRGIAPIRSLLAITAVAVVAALAQTAAAAPRQGFATPQFELQADEQQPGGAQRPPHRDWRRDKRGHGRLTEEERRELRRDLDRAGREIYKGRK